MRFLEELENNQEENQEESKGKTPRQLWEGCFKYFQHFTSIIQKEKKVFSSQFNLTFLNTINDCQICGPYEIKRTASDNELKLEVKMFSKLSQSIVIKRKDHRSAEILSHKLSKDGILSTAKQNKAGQDIVEINPSIVSMFYIILRQGTNFYIEYKNVCSSTKRTIKLPIEKINEAYMDELAKYILGQNPDLYTEKISSQEITKIRAKIEMNQVMAHEKDMEIQAEIEEQEKLRDKEKANSIKEKSKKFIANKGKEVKSKFFGKLLNSLKRNSD